MVSNSTKLLPPELSHDIYEHLLSLYNIDLNELTILKFNLPKGSPERGVHLVIELPEVINFQN